MIELASFSLPHPPAAEGCERILALFRALIENSAEGIATIDHEGKFLFHSGGAQRILGVPPEDLIGSLFFARIHAHDQFAVIQDFRKLLQVPGGRVISEFRFLHGDGSWRWLSSHKTNLLNDPDVRAIVSNYRDITVQRESERALRESEERFREMADHIKEAFFVTDVATRAPLYVSPYCAEIWGRPMGTRRSQENWIKWVHADDRAAVREVFGRTLKGEPTDQVFRIVRPDTTVRWVRGRAYPVRDAAGVVRRVVGVAADVTDLREAEERFTQAQKMEAVGRLAGGVAHDFNNLLTVIIAETELMITDETSDKKDINLLKEVRSAAESAVVLTRQLLAFSRRELVEPTVFCIDDAVTETSKMLRRLIGEDVRLMVKLASCGASIRMDRGQLDQILTNLAVNSRDAMPHGGSLLIETSVEEPDPAFTRAHPAMPPGQVVVLTITDTGVGMSAEICERAFEPFFTTKSHGKGTGLGLATCHGIVLQSGGDIVVQSTPGSGTTFRIYMPRVVTADTPRDIGVRDMPRGHESILLVEDEPGVRKVAARMLRTQGYAVLEARDAAEAIRILNAGDARIHLLLTDVVMPGMGGRELSELVRAQRPDIKVLYTTGYTDDMILQHQVLERGVSLLRKPYTAVSLGMKVRDTLDAP